jgi:hypothetical protein
MGSLEAFVRRSVDVQDVQVVVGNEQEKNQSNLIPNFHSTEIVNSSIQKIKSFTSASELSDEITKAFAQFQGFIDREGVWGPWRLVTSWFGDKTNSTQLRRQRSEEILFAAQSLRKRVEIFNKESGELLREVMPRREDLEPHLKRENSEATINLNWNDVQKQKPVYGEAYLVSQYSFAMIEIGRDLEKALIFISDLEGRSKFSLHFPTRLGWKSYAEGLFGSSDDEEGEYFDSPSNDNISHEELVNIEQNGSGTLDIYGDFPGFRKYHPFRTVIHWLNSRFFIFAWKAVVLAVVLCVSMLHAERKEK